MPLSTLAPRGYILMTSLMVMVACGVAGPVSGRPSSVAAALTVPPELRVEARRASAVVALPSRRAAVPLAARGTPSAASLAAHKAKVEAQLAKHEAADEPSRDLCRLRQ